MNGLGSKIVDVVNHVKNAIRHTSNFITRDNFDKWLDRINKLSQLGLFLLTFIIFKYTVVPLYQKDLLEESIAKKEIELTKLQLEIGETIFKNKWARFLDYSSAACGSVLLHDDDKIKGIHRSVIPRLIKRG